MPKKKRSKKPKKIKKVKKLKMHKKKILFQDLMKNQKSKKLKNSLPRSVFTI